MRRKHIKRENGSGSIYIRKDLKRRPYYVTAPAKYQESDGHWATRRETVGTYATLEEAERALDAYMRIPSGYFRVTVGEVIDRWLERAAQDKAAGTVRAYRSMAKHLMPLSDLPLRDLKLAHCQELMDGLELTKGSAHIVKVILGAVCDFGVKHELINRDYSKLLDISGAENGHRDAFKELEVERIRQAIGTVEWADVIYFLCYTGWRISELLSLTRFNWNADAGILTGGSKTNAGRNRRVPVHPNVRPILEQWIAKGGETIFCREDGSKWDGNTWRQKCYYPAIDTIGVRHLPPHSCRHTAVTMAAAAGLRPEEMRAIFGHVDYEIEITTYIHPEDGTLARAIRNI